MAWGRLAKGRHSTPQCHDHLPPTDAMLSHKQLPTGALRVATEQPQKQAGTAREMHPDGLLPGFLYEKQERSGSLAGQVNQDFFCRGRDGSRSSPATELPEPEILLSVLAVGLTTPVRGGCRARPFHAAHGGSKSSCHANRVVPIVVPPPRASLRPGLCASWEGGCAVDRFGIWATCGRAQ